MTSLAINPIKYEIYTWPNVQLINVNFNYYTTSFPAKISGSKVFFFIYKILYFLKTTNNFERCETDMKEQSCGSDGVTKSDGIPFLLLAILVNWKNYLYIFGPNGFNFNWLISFVGCWLFFGSTKSWENDDNDELFQSNNPHYSDDQIEVVNYSLDLSVRQTTSIATFPLPNNKKFSERKKSYERIFFARKTCNLIKWDLVLLRLKLEL